MKRKPPRDLTEEERALWNYITRDVEPIYGTENKKIPSPPAAARPPLSPLSRESVREKGKSTAPFRRPGDYAGVDAATARKLKRGHLYIDRKLDLHGHNREQARIALLQALDKMREEGGRMLLVITGKGGRGGKEGVLQQAVPRWLGEPELAPYVLVFDTARPEHGGAGALYVLLRRRR